MAGKAQGLGGRLVDALSLDEDKMGLFWLLS